MKRTFIISIIVILLFTFSPMILAENRSDWAFLCQVANDKKTVYIVRADGSESRPLISGKNIEPFEVGKHFLVYVDHKLYQYDLSNQQLKLLTEFKEDHIYIQKLSNGPDAPDQALVIAENMFERNLYILEFSDGSSRLVQNTFSGGSAGSSSLKGLSPDQKKISIVKQAPMSLRFELSLQEKIKDRFKTTWSLPQDMTIIPESPVWSPDSSMLVFYAKQFESIEGFYSLYLLNTGTKELNIIQEQVFSKFSFGDFRMGPFTPNWSPDSKNIVFQYQPYGLPTGSSIIKYNSEENKKVTLVANSGHHLYPLWSPSGNWVLYLGNPESTKDQAYTVSSTGNQNIRLSPPDGYTEWAAWCESN